MQPLPIPWKTWLWIAVATVLSLCLQARAAASTLSPADAKQVRAVVQGQLDALAADNAEKAFSYAAPGIRERFGTADRFMEMVRSGYPVVHRPASVAFQLPEHAADGVIQPVRMTDAQGAAWVAVYLVQKQKDGRWRIAGCEVRSHEGRTA